MFTARTARDHSARKRMLANIYSKAHIQSSQAAHAQATVILFERLLPLLKASTLPEYKPNGIDVHSAFLATSMDFISAYVFGINSSTNFIQNKAYRHHWLEMYMLASKNGFWLQEMPNITGFFQKFGVWLYPRSVEYAGEELAEWNLAQFQKAMANVSQNSAPAKEPAFEPVVLKAFETGVEKEAASNGDSSVLDPAIVQQRHLSAASEVLDHVIAGQETTGITLTYLTWRLSKNRDLQRQLRDELLTLEPNMSTQKDRPGRLPDLKHLDSLPLLHAVIMETLRLHGPVPGPQPRVTPYPRSRIGQYEVPGGVRIAAAAHNLHLDERVFPDALEWNHKRWIQSEATEEEWSDRHRQFWAFGSGGRMCIGSHFAINEMKLIVAAIYTNFTTHIVNDQGIEQLDGFVAGPASGRLILRFEPVKS